MTRTESALMHQYLATTDVKEEDELVAALLSDHAVPAIRKTVTRRLLSSPEQDRDDVAGEVILDLTARLKSLKKERGAIIERFTAYAVVCAQNGCDRYLRLRHPERHRLKNRLRYLIGKSPEFRIWEHPGHGWVCGRTGWQGRPPKQPPPDLMSRLGQPNRPPQILLEEVFRESPAPLDLDALVGICGIWWGIRDHEAHLELMEETTASKEPGADDVIAGRERLAQLWHEISELPPAQRVALLLNLRDPGGGSAVWLLPAAGVASIRKIAQSLEISAEGFAELWPRLPLNDLEIADRLGIVRQQVINLRQAARQRLARRLRKEVE
jgi:RNA polymerase sigma factor (sigma-70 family)